jgi:hypothetical protein
MKKHLCPACGQKIENGQNFCPNCGCPLSWVDCPACGHEIENGQNFCPNCGCSINLKEEQSVEISSTEEVIENRSPVLEEATKKVTILGDSEVLMNWTASILKNDIKIGEISPNEKVELDIDEECYLKFKCSLGSTICKVKPGGCVVVYCDNKGLKCKVTNGTNDINDKSTIIIALFLIVVFMVAGITAQKGKERERVEQERIEQQRIEQERIEQQRLEQEKERREKERREREQREQQERENSQRKNRLCSHPWKRIHGNPYGTCYVECIKFTKDGSGYLWTKRYAGGNLIRESSGEWFSYRLDGNRIYIEGTYEFSFGAEGLVSKRGERFESGDSLYD